MMDHPTTEVKDTEPSVAVTEPTPAVAELIEKLTFDYLDESRTHDYGDERVAEAACEWAAEVADAVDEKPVRT